MNSTTLVTVPFAYKASYIPAKCRKERYAALRSSLDIELQFVVSTSAPEALKWQTLSFDDQGGHIYSDQVRRWYRDQLWMPYEYRTARTRPSHVSLEELVQDLTEDCWSYRLFDHMDHHFNFRNRPAECPTQSEWFKDHPEYASSNLRYFGSNQEVVIDALKAKAQDIIVIDGMLWVPGGEPRYMVNTFGLGHNHGGTGMFIETRYNDNIPKTSYFRADEYDKAREYADAVASGRGDDKSLPVEPESVIEVLMPETVTLNPMEEHGEGCDFINRIEAGIQAAGPVGGLVAATQELTKKHQ